MQHYVAFSTRHKRRMVARRHEQLTAVDKILSLLLVLVGSIGLLYVVSPAVFQSAASPRPVASKIETVKTPPSSPVLGRSQPTRVTAPDISLSADLITTGQNAAGEIDMPERYDVAAWYTLSPTPGERGPSIIVGHVDTYKGPAIFFYLKELQPGQKVYVDRQDGSRVAFTVDRVILVDQNNFPTQEVYGNTEQATLRLITCGGAFDPTHGKYLQNTVVFATYDPKG